MFVFNNNEMKNNVNKNPEDQFFKIRTKHTEKAFY
jgi:hypothetical protein